MDKVKCPKCHWVNKGGHKTCEKCRTRLPQVRVADPKPRRQAGKQPVLNRGQLFAGRYTIHDVLGQGGMGCIYRVYDNTLKEDVALKTLLPQLARDKNIVSRFRNEARIARALSHPHIGRVHDIGLAKPEEVLYISMELIEGQSLRSMLDGLPPGERLPIRVTLRLLDELCAALEYAHRYTIHRDIKPENVMVDQQGTVKLMDFGISKLMSNTQLTATSVIMGTPQYMSPEQLKDSKNVDGRADVYSIGVMLYEIVTGAIPTGMLKPASQIRKDVPPSLDPIIQKCVEPNPDDRYQSAQELRAALVAVRKVVTLGTQQPPVERKAPRAPFPARKVLGGLLICAIAVLAALAVWQQEDQRRAELSAWTETQVPTAAASGSLKGQWELLSHRVNRAQIVANRYAVRRPEWQACIEDAESHWEAAQRAAGSSFQDGLELGNDALQCYIAPIIGEQIRQEDHDMVFVPPGEADLATGAVWVDGFFIDRTEVTLESFKAFCEGVEGGWPNADSWGTVPDYPARFVSFYDAFACAQWQGKTIPTEAQWVRAAYGGLAADSPAGQTSEEPEGDEEDTTREAPATGLRPVGSDEVDVSPYGCLDMYGNVSEWTSTLPPVTALGTETAIDQVSEDMFGRLIVVRGLNYEDLPIQEEDRRPNAFEQRLPQIGFRCVRPLPSKPAHIDSLLLRAHTQTS